MSTAQQIGSSIGAGIRPLGLHASQHLCWAPGASRWFLFYIDPSDSSGKTVKAAYSNATQPDTGLTTWNVGSNTLVLSNELLSDNADAGGAGSFQGADLNCSITHMGSVDVVHLALHTTDGSNNTIGWSVRGTISGSSITWGTPAIFKASSNTPQGAEMVMNLGIGVATNGSGTYYPGILYIGGGANAKPYIATNSENGGGWTDAWTSPGSFGTLFNWSSGPGYMLGFTASQNWLAIADNQFWGGGSGAASLTNLAYAVSASGTFPASYAAPTIWASDLGAGVNIAAGSAIKLSDTVAYAFLITSDTPSSAAIQFASWGGVTSGNWTALTNVPLGTVQPRSDGGVACATDGANVWLFVVNENDSERIYWAKYNGSTWSSWSALVGAGQSAQSAGARHHITCGTLMSAGTIGVVWTEGTTGPTSLYTASLSTAAAIAATDARTVTDALAVASAMGVRSDNPAFADLVVMANAAGPSDSAALLDLLTILAVQSLVAARDPIFISRRGVGP